MNDQQARSLHRAERAKRLMEDDVLQEALSYMKSAVRDQIFDLPVSATAEREQLIMMDKMRQQFEHVLLVLINDGEVTKYELTAEQNVKVKLNAIRERARAY